MSETFYNGTTYSQGLRNSGREASVRDPGERPYRGGEYDYIQDYTRPGDMGIYHGNPRGRDQEMGRNADMAAGSTAASFDSTGKRKSFRRLITRFAEKTSMQGVPYINSAKFWWAKALWTLALLAAVAAMVLHLWFLISQYLGFPTVTKVTLGFSNLRFPSVTLCNTNTMHKGRFDTYTESPELTALVEAMNPRNLVPDQFNPNYDPSKAPPAAPTRKKRFVDKYDGVNKTNYRPDYKDYDDEQGFNPDEYDAPKSSTYELYELFTELYMDIPLQDRIWLGHQIGDMLLDCSFGGRECNESLFKVHPTSTYGNCWTLESDRFTVQDAGPAGGLSMTLFLETSEYLQGITNGFGIRLQVHPPNTIPFPEDEGQYIPAAMETSLALKFIKITRLGKPYNTCEGGAEFQKTYNRTFTRRACREMCSVSYMIGECGCFADSMEEIAVFRAQKSKPCRTDQERSCQSRVEKKLSRKEVSCKCDNPCSEVKYERAPSNRQWPSNEYAMVLLEALCEEDVAECKEVRGDLTDTAGIANNFIKLNIYYEELNFEELDESPEIEDQQFASDVGGAIGLWIGLSMLSMCEVLQLVMELIDYACHKMFRSSRKNRKKKRKSKRHADPESNRARNIDIYSERDKEKQWPHTEFGVPESRFENSYDKYPRQFGRQS